MVGKKGNQLVAAEGRIPLVLVEATKAPWVPAGQHLPVAEPGTSVQQSSSFVTATPTVARGAHVAVLAPFWVYLLPAVQVDCPPEVGAGVAHVNGVNPPVSGPAPPRPKVM